MEPHSLLPELQPGLAPEQIARGILWPCQSLSQSNIICHSLSCVSASCFPTDHAAAMPDHAPCMPARVDWLTAKRAWINDLSVSVTLTLPCLGESRPNLAC